MILHNAQYHHDHASPPDPPCASEREYRSLCFDSLEAAIEAHLRNERTLERHIPEQYRRIDAPDLRCRYERLIETLEEMQVEFTDGGRIEYTKSR